MCVIFIIIKVFNVTSYFSADTDTVSRAFNLGLAAILGKGVYNFGELVRPFYFILLPISAFTIFNKNLHVSDVRLR